MWRVLILFSILPIATALIARWWFGTRILAEEGKRSCRCNPVVWNLEPQVTGAPGDSEASASVFGEQLRNRALKDWMARDPKSAKSRENSRRFGMAVPPFSGLIAIAALVVAKIPVFGVIAIVLAATALASAIGLLSLAAELRAIAYSARSIRESKAFPRRDDEDAVIHCAVALAWKHTLPPILSALK